MTSPTPRRDVQVRTGAGAAAQAHDTAGGASTVGAEFTDIDEKPWSQWDLVPPDVLDTLSSIGCLPEPSFAAGTQAPRVRRRGETYLSRASAWVVDPHMLVVVDAVRPLTKVGGSTFRPSGPYTLDVRRHVVTGNAVHRRGTVPVDELASDPSRPASTGDSSQPDGVIAFLPAVVRRQITTTVPQPTIEEDHLIQTYRRGKPVHQHAVDLRASDTAMIVTVAERRITPSRLQSVDAAERALAATPWEVSTMTATLGRAETFALAVQPRSRARRVDGPGERREIE